MHGRVKVLRPSPRSLDRFRFAQAERGCYERALREIKQGRKQTHWMWFVFPQLRALSKSEAADYFGIADLAEAKAYIADPLLRRRLAEVTIATLKHRNLMFAHPDDHKLRSCMTLFAKVVEDASLPLAVLEKFFGGKQDQLTLDVLAGKKITLPAPRAAKLREGRVAATRAVVEPSSPRRRRGEPMLRSEVESYVRRFGLSTADTRRMVDEWMADRGRAVSVAWDEANDPYNA